MKPLHTQSLKRLSYILITLITILSQSAIAQKISIQPSDAFSPQARISGDGKYAVYSIRESFDGYLGDLDIYRQRLCSQTAQTCPQRELVNVSVSGSNIPWENRAPAISENGQHIAFRQFSSAGHSIYYRDMNKPAAELIYNVSFGTFGSLGFSDVGLPEISNDGRFIVFSLLPFGSLNPEIWIQDLDQDRVPKKIVDVAYIDINRRLSLSGDGKYLAYYEITNFSDFQAIIISTCRGQGDNCETTEKFKLEDHQVTSMSNDGQYLYTLMADFSDTNYLNQFQVPTCLGQDDSCKSIPKLLNLNKPVNGAHIIQSVSAHGRYLTTVDEDSRVIVHDVEEEFNDFFADINPETGQAYAWRSTEPHLSHSGQRIVFSSYPLTSGFRPYDVYRSDLDLAADTIVDPPFIGTCVAGQSSWHNRDIPADLDGDRQITPFDGQLLAEYIKSNEIPVHPLPQGALFLDVNDDCSVNIADFNLFLEAINQVAPTPSCDFNGDRTCDKEDIDLLVSQITSGVHDPEYDINKDAKINIEDINTWLSAAATENGFASPYLLGDANLDGTVDSTDLNHLAQNWTAKIAKWSSGDFNASGSVDAGDLNKLAQNWMKSIL